MSEEYKIYFITIKHPDSPFDIMTKVKTAVYNHQTPNQIAKILRIGAANHPNGYIKGTTFKPSHLAWAIFESVESTNPIKKSSNWK